MSWRPLVLAALSALASGAAAQEGEPPPDLVIAHFNDFHGQILPRRVVRQPGRPPVEAGGLAALDHRVARLRAEHGERLWVTNGGDWFQGTPEGGEDRGAGVMAGLERLRLTASVVGNHEYDFGERHLIALLDGVRHPVLGANVLERGTGRLRPYVRPYLVKSVPPRAGGDPVRIALVGLITRDTPQVSTGPFGSAAFAGEAETLAALWPALRRDADLIVLLTHCGLTTDRALAERFPEVALILGGHSHTVLRGPVRVGDTVIAQSGSRGTALTELRCAVRRGAPDGDPPRLSVVGFDFVDVDPAGGRDAATERWVAERFAALAARWDHPLGEVTGDPDVRRSGSTPAGNFVAGLIRAAGDAEVGLMNKGGVRTTLRPGPITRRQVFELLPFDNTVVTLELTGAELREVLAQGLAAGRRPLEIDGGTYSLAVVDGVRVLRRVTVQGQPLEVDRQYRVATNSFLAGGGDGATVLSRAPRLGENPKFLRDLMIDHLAATGAVRLRDRARIELDPN